MATPLGFDKEEQNQRAEKDTRKNPLDKKDEVSLSGTKGEKKDGDSCREDEEEDERKDEEDERKDKEGGKDATIPNNLNEIFIKEMIVINKLP